MFEWKETYSVGVETIDNQHKKLFEIGRRIGMMIFSEEELTFQEINEIYEELILYAKYHFDYEEKLLESVNYPYMDSHKYEHNQFIEKILYLHNNYVASSQKDSLSILINFTMEWITNHILMGDMKYKTYIQE